MSGIDKGGNGGRSQVSQQVVILLLILCHSPLPQSYEYIMSYHSNLNIQFHNICVTNFMYAGIGITQD
jgi:hypothetical protein